MLLENMQRSDLTLYEQAQGIQQCLDFGFTEDEIATSTGFSASTVRRRVKMLELDGALVEKAIKASLDDYILLEDIDDLDVRNKLMKEIGKESFKRSVYNAIEDQSFQYFKKELLEFFKAKKVKEIKERIWNKHQHYDYLNTSKSISKFMENNVNTIFKDIYYLDSKSHIILLEEKKADDTEPTENEIKIEKLEGKIRKLKAKTLKIVEVEKALMKDFIDNINTFNKRMKNDIVANFIENSLNSNNGSVAKYLNHKYGDNFIEDAEGSIPWEKIYKLNANSKNIINLEPESVMLQIIYGVYSSGNLSTSYVLKEMFNIEAIDGTKKMLCLLNQLKYKEGKELKMVLEGSHNHYQELDQMYNEHTKVRNKK